MKRLIPNIIYACGDYYQSPGLRELCHRVKKGADLAAMDEAVRRLIEVMPDGPHILVPVPNCATDGFYYTDILCAMIADKRKDCEVAPLIYAEKKVRLYDLKKQRSVTEADCGFSLDRAEDLYIPMDARILLVDNVIGTGTTMSAAIRVLSNRPCDALVIAVDFNAFNAVEDEG